MSDEEEQPARPRRKRRAKVATEEGASASAKPKPEGAPAVATEAQAQSVHRPLVAAAFAAAIGLAIVGTSSNPVGPWILAAGVLGLIASIHRLGRLGPA